MIAADHFAHVLDLGRHLEVSCEQVDQVLFIPCFGHVFALSYREVEGAKPAFTLLRKNDPVYSAVDGWILNDEGKLMTECYPHKNLGQLVFGSIFQHALHLKNK